MMKIIICATVLMVSVVATSSQGIMIVGSKTIRADQNYSVAISNYNPSIRSVNLSILIETCCNEDNPNSIQESVMIPQKTHKMLHFHIPAHWPTGDYRLYVNGENGFTYNQNVDLTLVRQSVHGLIQISKPVYQPGELVRFRVIVLDDELIPPANIKSVQVSITDPLGNVTREWSEAPLNVGVFDGDFQLSAIPTLGPYHVTATVKGERLVSETFEVQDYVPTHIDVEVRLNSIPVLEDQGLNLTVSAKYPLGQPARGTARLDLYIEGDVLDQTKTVSMNGMANLQISFFKPPVILEEEHNVRLKVTFTDDLTNRTETKKQQITVYRHRYYVTLNMKQERFTPHQAFECALKIQLPDKTLAAGITALVQIEGIFHDIEKNMTSNNEGLIELSLLPTESTDTIDITVLINGEERLYQEIERNDGHLVPNGNEINLSIQLDSPINLYRMQFKVVCSERMTILLYYVVAKGNIIESGRKDVNSKKRYTLQFNQTYKMAPKAKVLVATVLDGQLLQDFVIIDFKRAPNGLKIQMDKQMVDPGQEIKIKVGSRPDAYAAILSIRKTKSQFKNEVNLFSSDMFSKHAYFGKEHIKDSEVFFLGIEEFNTELKSSSTPMGKEQELLLNPVDTHFSEPWLWENTVLDSSGTWNINTSASQTTGFWQITGFSIHPFYGFEIVSYPVALTVSKPFFIQEMLPYSIKQDKVAMLAFILFNNVDSECLAQVVLKSKNQDFQFIGQSYADKTFEKTVSVEPSVPTPFTILIKAERLGEIAVQIEAKCHGNVYFDAVEKIIRVSPGSLVKQDMRSYLFCRKDYGGKTFSITLNIGKKADVGSQQIAFLVNPNILETVAQNLGELLDVPSGNGETNMVKFVPNIVVLDYLTAIGSKETNVMNIATKHLRTGYQNQMRYRQTDGSFGVWSSGGGSVFLTAFVAKAIQTASKYISEVDVTMVSSAFQWLANKQQSSGRFDEVGPVYNNTMQGGLQTNTNGIALTSYVLIAFLENENAKITHAPVVERSIQYVAGLLPQVTDLYDLSIATYAMLLGDHHSKQHFIRRLMDKSTFSEYDTMRYWHRYPHSIETTGYALLAMVQGEKYPDSILVMRWLVKQGYVTGSIPRTQDTFVGLKALTKLAEVISPSRNNYFIQLKYKTQTKNFFVTSKDIGQLIFQDIPGDIEKLDISVAGLGFGLLNVKHQYAMDLRNYKHRFDLTLEKLNTSLDYELKLKICVSFIPNLIYERSNMALVEVNFPSGYVVDPRPITEATMVNPIQRTEIRFGGTSVVAYYASMGTEKNCFVTTAYRRFKVAVKRPAYVFVQDYYLLNLNAIMHYEVTP